MLSCLRLSPLLLWIYLSHAAAQPIRFRAPVACDFGRTCFIQYYVDADPGAGVLDYRCGRRTYNAHNGVDFRVPTLSAMREGVQVLAAAQGRVLRVRDGVADVSVRVLGREAVQGRECGNGIVIEHAHGFETQYCHLKRGSVRVRPGEEVEAGQPIGEIGLSGLTEYPHLHFTVLEHRHSVDPFSYGAPAGQCGQGQALWQQPYDSMLPYRSGEVINAGFADGPVTMESVEEGRAGAEALSLDSPAVVAFVRAIGLQQGDIQRLSVSDEQGRKLVERELPALDGDKAQFLVAAGLRRPAEGWSLKRLVASYKVLRGGRIVLEHTFEAKL
jgi:hypothetical protein